MGFPAEQWKTFISSSISRTRVVPKPHFHVDSESGIRKLIAPIFSTHRSAFSTYDRFFMFWDYVPMKSHETSELKMRRSVLLHGFVAWANSVRFYMHNDFDEKVDFFILALFPCNRTKLSFCVCYNSIFRNFDAHKKILSDFDSACSKCLSYQFLAL